MKSSTMIELNLNEKESINGGVTLAPALLGVYIGGTIVSFGIGVYNGYKAAEREDK